MLFSMLFFNFFLLFFNRMTCRESSDFFFSLKPAENSNIRKTANDDNYLNFGKFYFKFETFWDFSQQRTFKEKSKFLFSK